MQRYVTIFARRKTSVNRYDAPLRRVSTRDHAYGRLSRRVRTSFSAFEGIG
jgi:hypothetical protein